MKVIEPICGPPPEAAWESKSKELFSEIGREHLTLLCGDLKPISPCGAIRSYVRPEPGARRTAEIKWK